MKSRGCKGYGVAWKQMWKQSLFTSNKLRTVNQGVSGQDIGLTLGAGEQAQDEPADNKHQGQLDKAL
jgi:hypothetical protein